MQSFMKPTKRVVCPYCLSDIRYKDNIEKCANEKCNRDLPAVYVQNFERAYPFFVQLIGWTQVGKTTYLQALSAILEGMERFWPGDYACTPVTESSMEFARNNRGYMDSGKMEAPTMDIADAFILQLQDAERWGWRTLVTRDVPGEPFAKLELPLQYIPYLLHVPTSLMMISLPNLEKDPRFRMTDLMNSYVNTLSANWPNFVHENRSVVVILSKVDEYVNQLPEALQKYYADDPFTVTSRQFTADGNFMDRYVKQMSDISCQIRDWIREYEGAKMLANIAKNYGIRVEYSILSSTGTPDITNRKANQKVIPHRVLDPLFWSLEFQPR